MNRYAALGLVLDAYEGKRIIVLSPSHNASRDALEECARSPFAEGAEVRRANGAERITFGTLGCIRFQNVLRPLRGMFADVVFIDEAADRELQGFHRDDLYRDIQLVTAASRDDAPVIRA